MDTTAGRAGRLYREHYQMSNRYKRREFVRVVSYGLVGWTLVPLGLRARRRGGLSAVLGAETSPGGLPPRTIGARTLGGFSLGGDMSAPEPRSRISRHT